MGAKGKKKPIPDFEVRTSIHKREDRIGDSSKSFSEHVSENLSGSTSSNTSSDSRTSQDSYLSGKFSNFSQPPRSDSSVSDSEIDPERPEKLQVVCEEPIASSESTVRTSQNITAENLEEYVDELLDVRQTPSQPIDTDYLAAYKKSSCLQTMTWPPELEWAFWKSMPREGTIRKICAIQWKIPRTGIQVSRVYPSHPLYTDYEVQGLPEKQRVVFRAYLPTCPRLKTLSTIATMKYLKTTFLKDRIPEVVAHCAEACKTGLHFEYLIMKYPMEGVSLDQVLQKSTRKQRARLGRQLAELWDEWQKDSKFHFSQLGSIYEREKDDDSLAVTDQFYIGYMHKIGFVHEKRAYMTRPGNEFGLNAGPFDSLYDLQLALLQSHLRRSRRGPEVWYGRDFEHADEDWKLDASDMDDCVELLKSLPSKDEYTGRSFVLQRDFDCADILVDPETFEITTLPNWEDTTIVPDFDLQDTPGMFRHPPSRCTWRYSRDGEHAYVDFPDEYKYLKEIEKNFLHNRLKGACLSTRDAHLRYLWWRFGSLAV